MLEVTSLATAYGASQVLFELSFEVGAGEVVTLLGRNGMGKTTCVNTIMGIVPALAGAVHFEGQALTGMASHRIARSGLGLVPEGRQIFPNLSVHENLVATAANRHGATEPWTVSGIYALFPSLAARRGNMGNQLSGGEQQMLAIGRALMTNPKLLILDEATEGLAPLVRKEIWRVLEMLKQRDQAILVIDKNVDALTRIADRHYIIEKGTVVWQGESNALRADEAAQHRYLGV
jgi:branched-chain amino acid transport system ATP-binding protein